MIKIDTPITSASGPHNGAVIHHQDQLITPVNWSIRNTKNSMNIGEIVQDINGLSDMIIKFYSIKYTISVRYF